MLQSPTLGIRVPLVSVAHRVQVEAMLIITFTWLHWVDMAEQRNHAHENHGHSIMFGCVVEHLKDLEEECDAVPTWRACEQALANGMDPIVTGPQQLEEASSGQGVFLCTLPEHAMGSDH